MMQVRIKIMYTIFTIVMISLLTSCANTIKVRAANDMMNKSGVIGVFRQPIGFCSGGYAQRISINGSKVVVKPTWTSNQDNVFSIYLDPGIADIEKYSYGCGSILTTVTFKDKSNNVPTFIVPKVGFCKIVISLLKGSKFFEQDDDLILSLLDREKIGIEFERIPYCEIQN